MRLGGAWAGRIATLVPVALIGLALLALGGVAAFVTLVIIGAVGLAGAASGLWAGAVNFRRVLAAARAAARQAELDVPPLPRWFNRHPQPAFLLPAYGRAWHISSYLWRRVWGSTCHDATAWFRRSLGWRSRAARRPVNNPFDSLLTVGEYGVSAGLYLGGFFHFVAAFLIVGGVTLGLLLLTLLGVVVTSALVLALGLFNRLYAAYYRITIRCPNCHSEMPIPVYICDRCGTPHDRLWPSVYGVRYHECKGRLPDGTVCRNCLPTADWWGRGRLDQVCPACGHTLAQGIGRETNVHIPIVGGPAAGKTSFLVAATHELKEVYGPRRGLGVRLLTAEAEASLARSIAMLRAGRPIAKTPDAEDSAPAYTVEIKRRGRRVPSLLYLYDAAGEHYTREERALRQVYFRYVQGVIFVIDPFSIDQVRAEYRDQLAAAPRAPAPSAENLESVYERMLRVMEASHGPHPGRRFPQPVAVVITKVDAFDLERHIGLPAARELMRRDPRLRFEEDAINVLVEQFLVRKGAYNFVSSLHSQFSTVKYFSCSALGYDPASRFKPVRTLQPLLWIMGEVGALPVRQERARSVDRYDREQARLGRRGLRYYLWDSLEPARISLTGQERDR
ncbi:MAG: TRAFAC clade GTPase domain-containing protein [Aggregatilineales bacterium]